MFVADPKLTGRMNLPEETQPMTPEQEVVLTALCQKHDRPLPDGLTEHEADRMIAELQDEDG